MVGKTYRKVKGDFWFIFFVIIATNLSFSIYSITVQRTLKWGELFTLVLQHGIAVFISMGIVLYFFKGLSKKDWNLFSW